MNESQRDYVAEANEHYEAKMNWITLKEAISHGLARAEEGETRRTEDQVATIVANEVANAFREPRSLEGAYASKVFGFTWRILNEIEDGLQLIFVAEDGTKRGTVFLNPSNKVLCRFAWATFDSEGIERNSGTDESVSRAMSTIEDIQAGWGVWLEDRPVPIDWSKPIETTIGEPAEYLVPANPKPGDDMFTVKIASGHWSFNADGSPIDHWHYLRNK